MNQNANKSSNPNANTPKNDDQANPNGAADATAAPTSPVAATKRSLKNLPWSKIGKSTAAAAGALALGAAGFLLARKYNVPGLTPIANSLR